MGGAVALSDLWSFLGEVAALNKLTSKLLGLYRDEMKSLSGKLLRNSQAM